MKKKYAKVTDLEKLHIGKEVKLKENISNYTKVSISTIKKMMNLMLTKGVNTSRWLNL